MQIGKVSSRINFGYKLSQDFSEAVISEYGEEKAKKTLTYLKKLGNDNITIGIQDKTIDGIVPFKEKCYVLNFSPKYKFAPIIISRDINYVNKETLPIYEEMGIKEILRRAALNGNLKKVSVQLRKDFPHKADKIDKAITDSLLKEKEAVCELIPNKPNFLKRIFNLLKTY